MKPIHEKPLRDTACTGYTIIEVLIALAIFSIGIMAMGALQAASLRTTGNIARMTEAWALLDERAESLKAMPFYANNDGIDNDGDGTIDEFNEEMPELAAGTYNEPRANGRYTVHWNVVDDLPIPARLNTELLYIDGLAAAGPHTVSKTITVWVTRAGDVAQADALAIVQFVKTWAAQSPPIP